MELCETCTERNCRGRIVETKQENLTIIKCLDYEKDKEKIKGYKKPLERTAKLQSCVMKGLISDWSVL